MSVEFETKDGDIATVNSDGRVDLHYGTIKVSKMGKPKIPLFVCQECGHKFYSVKAAERASFGESGCPSCGGTDIDIVFPSRTK